MKADSIDDHPPTQLTDESASVKKPWELVCGNSENLVAFEKMNSILAVVAVQDMENSLGVLALGLADYKHQYED
ncbi:hypothetical protein FACS1894122_07430 [Alphaproteobacteria bacterium]|nr:hypothetical protein FACS1894122_07430 [Alphaproteobacteria bacterium]